MLLLQQSEPQSSVSVSRRRLLRTSAIVGAGGLAGCLGTATDTDSTLQTAWVTETQTEYEQNHHEPTVVELDSEWVVGVPRNDVLDGDGCGVVALDGTGSVRWQDTHGLKCGPHSVGDMTAADVDGDGRAELLVATKTQGALAYDPLTGDRVVEKPLIETVPYGAPAVAGGEEGPLLAVADNTGTLHVAPPDGGSRWQHTLDSIVYPSPLFEDVTGDGRPDLFVAGGNRPGVVVAFDIDGQIRWEETVPDGIRTWGLRDTAERAHILLSTWQGSVVSIDAVTGEILWETTAARKGEIGGFGGETVFASAHSGVVTAMDPTDGSKLWRQTGIDADGPAMAPAIGPVTGNDTQDVVFFGHDGTVALLDADTGDIRHEQTVDGRLFTSPQIVDLTAKEGEEILALYGDSRVVVFSYTGVES